MSEEKKKQKKVAKEKEETKAEENEKQETGFPDDVDFKRFLGCGG